MTPEQIRAILRAAMDRGDTHAVSLCNRALRPGVPARDLQELVAEISTREDLRERVLRGEA